MAKQSLSPEQQDQRQRKREQQERDEERARFGSQGAASECRKIDVASVDTAALLARLEQASRRVSRPVDRGFLSTLSCVMRGEGLLFNAR
jgi:hypothetical protein